MEHLPTGWFALTVVVFLLGLKHGFDPDHLAAINGLTRYNMQRRPRVSRFSGLLFSLGHGAVVTLVAVVVATIAGEWRTLVWLEHTGAWISIFFLLSLGVANLVSVFRTPEGESVPLIGLKSRLFRRFTETSHPLVIAAVGAAFALSFDTISQTVLFSLTGSDLAGWLFSAALGLIFTLGMLVTDALNGLWISRLIQRADQRAALASRLMSLAIAMLSLAIAGLGMARYFYPAIEPSLEGVAPLLGPAIIAVVLLAFAVAMRLCRPVPAGQSTN